MGTQGIKNALLVSILAFAAFSVSAQSGGTFSGTVTDSMCGKKHGMAGMSSAQCARKCAQSGADYALVSGDKVYTLKGDKAAIDKFAGANVTVQGDADGKTIMVKSIKRGS